MENIILKEDKLNKLKASKYKSAYNKKLLLKSLKIGVIFAILMIIIRCLALWILSFESEIAYKEIITSRYYYGSKDVNLWGYVYFLINEILDFFFSQSLVIVMDTGGFSFLDWIFVVVFYIYAFVLLVVLSGIFILVPILHFVMKVICTIDSIIPLGFGIFYGWFLYLSIFGTLGSFMLMKKEKKDIVNFQEIIMNRNLKKTLENLLVSIIVISFIGINFTGKLPKSDEFKNVRELIVINNEKS